MGYYVGLRPPAEVSGQIASIQQDVWRRWQDTLIEPLVPHITVLPPPAVERIDPGKLELGIGRIAGDFFPLDVTLDDVHDIEAFPGHAAVVLGVTSDRALDLRRKLYDLLPGRQAPTTVLHLTLGQPRTGLRLSPKLIAEYRQKSAPLLPTLITIEGLTLFTSTGPRKYDARLIKHNEQA